MSTSGVSTSRGDVGLEGAVRRTYLVFGTSRVGYNTVDEAELVDAEEESPGAEVRAKGC
jgi:hypothetical protein